VVYEGEDGETYEVSSSLDGRYRCDAGRGGEPERHMWALTEKQARERIAAMRLPIANQQILGAVTSGLVAVMMGGEEESASAIMDRTCREFGVTLGGRTRSGYVCMAVELLNGISPDEGWHNCANRLRGRESVRTACR